MDHHDDTLPSQPFSSSNEPHEEHAELSEDELAAVVGGLLMIDGTHN